MARILVIDDDQTVRGVLRKALAGAGHEVVEAPGGQAGIELYRQAPADLVITDLFMPETDGLTVIEEVRKLNPETRIVSITAGEGDDCALARELGAERTFVKPFSIPDILRTVEELL
ncbi:MAG: response regulator [Candidatus Latescibacteria bacterium]|nr:response regulator [Candidatus Latescibacterota bacterium]